MINELKNAHVHLFWGFWFCYLLIRITGLYWLFFCGIALGIIVEIIQYFLFDNRELRIVDRIIDALTYFLGGCLNLILLV